MRDHAEEQLSPEDVAELGTDHLADGPLDDDGSFPLALDAEPASYATPLGQAILDNAEHYLNMPLREDAGVNQDSTGYIRTFFIEGIGGPWTAKTWDQFIELHPNSNVVKPEWCAAFASYCARKAYEALRQTPPAKFNASTSQMVKNFEAKGSFLRRENLFDADGAIQKEASVLPHPGDIVSFNCHTALLKQINTDGSFVTVEGNTYRGAPRRDGVYQCSRYANEKNKDGNFKLVGFCLLSSQAGQDAAAPTKQSAETAPVALQSTEPDATTQKVELRKGFAKGDRGPNVRELQEQLNAWMKSRQDTGLTALTCDGAFGPKTEVALTAYQKAEMQLDTPTGRADEATLRSLAEKLAGAQKLPAS